MRLSDYLAMDKSRTVLYGAISDNSTRMGRCDSSKSLLHPHLFLPFDSEEGKVEVYQRSWKEKIRDVLFSSSSIIGQLVDTDFMVFNFMDLNSCVGLIIDDGEIDNFEITKNNIMHLNGGYGNIGFNLKVYNPNVIGMYISKSHPYMRSNDVLLHEAKGLSRLFGYTLIEF